MKFNFSNVRNYRAQDFLGIESSRGRANIDDIALGSSDCFDREASKGFYPASALHVPTKSHASNVLSNAP